MGKLEKKKSKIKIEGATHEFERADKDYGELTMPYLLVSQEPIQNDFPVYGLAFAAII